MSQSVQILLAALAVFGVVYVAGWVMYARRAAVEGFLALAPDGLFPVGGYPGNDDDGRALQAGLDQAKLRTDMLNSARYLKAHKLSSGKLGATGFCWGGGTTNYLAATLGGDLQAAVPYYGAAADTAS